jgi:hypothetical protein
VDPGLRSANITYAPETSAEFPWNVGLYDPPLAIWRGASADDGGYIESVGAVSREEAVRIAEAWVNHRDEEMKQIMREGM